MQRPPMAERMAAGYRGVASAGAGGVAQSRVSCSGGAGDSPGGTGENLLAAETSGGAG